MGETLSSEQGAFHRLLTHFTNESIDPFDTTNAQFFERLIPGMRPEHAFRYVFAADQLKQMRIASPVVVDAATGQGYGAKIIKESIPGVGFIGVDINAETIASAREKYHEFGTFIQADVCNIPIPDHSADLVTAFETLEHLNQHDQTKFLRELKRVTKPGGRIIISVPYPSTVYRGENNKIHHGFGSGSHVYEPTATEVKSMIAGVGLTLKEEYGQAITRDRKAKIARTVNRVLPIWGLYSWFPKRDRRVQPMPNKPELTSLIHIFVITP